jgi:hypothetical protein
MNFVRPKEKLFPVSVVMYIPAKTGIYYWGTTVGWATPTGYVHPGEGRYQLGRLDKSPYAFKNGRNLINPTPA